jgi:CheY-like chemotaxis protein
MPKMNGYDASMAIRALDKADAKTIPIVALTANAFKEDIDKALEHGMNAHLAKPMDPEKVLEVTFKLLGI